MNEHKVIYQFTVDDVWTAQQASKNLYSQFLLFLVVSFLDPVPIKEHVLIMLNSFILLPRFHLEKCTRKLNKSVATLIVGNHIACS